MKYYFGIMWLLLIPLLIWSRWFGEAFIFDVILFGWVTSGISYVVLNERD